MTSRTRLQKESSEDNESSVRPKTEREKSPRRDAPRRLGNRFVNRIQEAGNSAISRLLGRQEGRQLDAETQSAMERSFGTDFSQVRLHDDETSQATADSLNAEAFTHGSDIYLGNDAPDLDTQAGKKLLAHELAHTIQQSQNPSRGNLEVGEDSTAFERSAEKAAIAASKGQSAPVEASSSAPAIQRKPRQQKQVKIAEVTAGLQKFFERARQAEKNQEFRVTPQVRAGIDLIFSQDPLGSLRIQSLVNRLDFPGDPSDFAQQIAKGLSGPVDGKLLERLAQMPVREKTPGRFGRLKQLVKETKPGKGQKPNLPDPLSGQKRFERGAKQLEEAGKQPEFSGEEEPKSSTGSKVRNFLLKPRSVDLLRVGRIARGLPEAFRGPKPPKPQISALPDAVEQAIQGQIQPGPLAAPKDGKDSGGLPDGQEVARALARRMMSAQQNGERKVTLRLGENVGKLDKVALFQDVKRIAQIVKGALSTQAAGINQVDLLIGDKIAPIRLTGRRRRGRN